MKNHFVAVAAIAVTLALLTTSCAVSHEAAEPAGVSVPASLNAWSAPCNLDLDWNQVDQSWVASYSAPTLGMQTDPGEYGDLIANDACDDATILSWQEARRASGQPDAICRVVWERDPAFQIHDVGCAVPVLAVTQ